MLIKSISVCNFGTISRYETTFRSGFHEIQISAAPELAAALELVLRNHTRNVPKRWIQDDTKIEAVMQTKQTDYRVVLTPNRNQSGLLLTAFDQKDADRTAQYLQMFPESAKKNGRNVFYGGNRNIYFALKRCDGKEKRKFANDVIWSQAFHFYRKRYVTGFQPIPIRNGYFLELRNDGRFAVEDARHNFCIGQLSESDERLARYLCFLQVADFWDGFEEIRNMHYERKPLILLDLLEFLDASVLENGKLQQTENFGHQILALTRFSCNESKNKHTAR